MSTPRLYVGNLSYDVGEDDLEVLFNGVGNVRSAEVVTNSRTQQSKGFAFVEMGTLEEAQRAIDVLDDEDFKGRRLNLNGARSEGPRDESDSSEENDSAGDVKSDETDIPRPPEDDSDDDLAEVPVAEEKAS